ncbi:MAG: hypothetical protein ACJ74W_12735 [Pyrinomonadaceae bacterium]
MTPQNDLDETPVPPRFDAVETETARPVEPLTEVHMGRRARLSDFLHTQRRAFSRSWPLALALCLLTAGVVVGTTALLYSRAAQPAAPQPMTQPPNNSAPARAQQAVPSAPALRVARPEAPRPAIAYGSTDAARVRRDELDERDADKHERKQAHKHKGHDGDADEGGLLVPGEKKKGKKGDGARLVDVIIDH